MIAACSVFILHVRGAIHPSPDHITKVNVFGDWLIGGSDSLLLPHSFEKVLPHRVAVALPKYKVPLTHTNTHSFVLACFRANMEALDTRV